VKNKNLKCASKKISGYTYVTDSINVWQQNQSINKIFHPMAQLNNCWSTLVKSLIIKAHTATTTDPEKQIFGLCVSVSNHAKN